MKPEDELRSLRDTDLWITSELQPRASALAALRPRRRWLTARALVSEFAVVAIVAAAVVGAITIQNRSDESDPVAVGPTLSPADSGEKHVITPATCSNLLDAETIERLTEEGLSWAGEAGHSILLDEPESELDPFPENGLVCPFHDENGRVVLDFAFALLPVWDAGATRQGLLDAGAEVVPGPIDRLTGLSGGSGGFAFGDGYWVWVHADGDGGGELLSTVFARAADKAVESGRVHTKIWQTELASDTPPAEWLERKKSITIRVMGSSGDGCTAKPNGMVETSTGQVSVHISGGNPPTVCPADWRATSYEIPLADPDALGSGPVTVTVIDDDSRTYWSLQLA